MIHSSANQEAFDKNLTDSMYTIHDRFDFDVVSSGFTIPPGYRTLNFSDLVSEASPFVHYGIPMATVYPHLAEKHFRFQLRRPVAARMVAPPSKDLEPFVRVLYGGFGSEKWDEAQASEFQRRFDPAPKTVQPSSYLAFHSDVLTPLAMTSLEVETGAEPYFFNHYVAFFDFRDIEQLAVVWNLLASRVPLIPVPTEWLDAGNEKTLRATIQSLKRACTVLYIDDKATTRSFIKSLAEKPHEVPEATRSLDSVCDQLIALGLTTPPPRYSQSHMDIPSGRLDSASLPRPSFLPRIIGPFPAYAIEIETQATLRCDAPCTELPPGHSIDISAPFKDHLSSRAADGRVTVVSPLFADFELVIPPSSEAIDTTLREQNATLSVSQPGHVLKQLLRLVGDLSGMELLAHSELLHLLDRMSSGRVKPRGEEIGRSQRLHSVSSAHLQGVLLQICSNRVDRMKSLLTDLCARNFIQIGLCLRCSHCRMQNWYSPDKLSTELSCQYCLLTFEFPVLDLPSKAEWHWRTRGPLSLEDGGAGSVSTAFAMRTLSIGLRLPIHWSPSLVLHSPWLEGELDLVGVMRERSIGAYPILIFGECKTHDRIQTSDLDKLRVLGEKFDHAVLVVSSLNTSFESAEIDNLRALKKALPERSVLGKRMKPLLVFSVKELLSASPFEAWDKVAPLLSLGARTQFGSLQAKIASACEASQIANGI